MSCNKQCHGCALKPGATANREAGNHLTAILSVLAAVPFHCHEKLGWMPDKDGYDVGQAGISRAVENLMTAPTLVHNLPKLAEFISDATPSGLPNSVFDDERQLIGKNPTCAGWQQNVAHLASQGWYSDKTQFHVRRAMARDAFHWMDRLKDAATNEKESIHRAIADVLWWFVGELKTSGVDQGDLFKRGNSR